MHQFFNIELVAIGSSAGGTEALKHIIPLLPGDFPCIVIVQHILKGFSELLAYTLNNQSVMEVKVASEGDPVKRGTAYIAGDGAHLRLSMEGGAHLEYSGQEKTSGHCPSVDELFSSVAALGPRAIGVILTGMGRDGASGLLKMRNAGAFTIGQDEESCVVYGMPQAAVENCAVTRQLPLDLIAGELITRTNMGRGKI